MAMMDKDHASRLWHAACVHKFGQFAGNFTALGGAATANNVPLLLDSDEDHAKAATFLRNWTHSLEGKNDAC